MKTAVPIYLGLALAAGATEPGSTARSLLPPVVEVEEEVYQYQPANNGAGPMWCSGSTCLVRLGDEVFASGLETIPGAKPLNNCRWFVLQRHANGWERLQVDPSGRTREPCPLVCFCDRRFFLSSNPTLVADPTAYSGPAQPEILEFSAAGPKGAPARILPRWKGWPEFTEHSYRSFATDGPRGEMILFQNIGYTHAEWTFRDATGAWAACGQLSWPWGATYEKPQPIRICYPNVALRNRTVHFCGVSDIVEPRAEWRAYKKEITGRDWDYDFRRLFYTWTPDISRGQFRPWIELASRDPTAGWISPGDLWIGHDGAAHLVWTERAIDERLREKFFPGARQSHSMNYAVVRDGQVTQRRVLALAEEGGSGEIAVLPRFQVTPENRLCVFCYFSGRRADGQALSENRLMEIHPDGSVSPWVKVPLRHPLNSYFTATIRAGTSPSHTLDLLGTRAGSGTTISYARLRLLDAAGSN